LAFIYFDHQILNIIILKKPVILDKRNSQTFMNEIVFFIREDIAIIVYLTFNDLTTFDFFFFEDFQVFSIVDFSKLIIKIKH
jgi:hypothetical protein